MSYANYTERTSFGGSQLTVGDITILKEPDALDEGARISDTITYIGNATYPLGSTETVGAGDTDYTTLFVNTYNEDDILRVKPDQETTNFTQYANLDFLCNLTHSCPSLDLRVVSLDNQLNIVDTFTDLPLELSGTSINSFHIRGFAVDISSNAEYLTLQARNPDGTGSANIEFKYFNSQLENAIDTSIEAGDTPSRSPTNIFDIETGNFFIDLSGASAIISALQSDVATLQTETADLSSAIVSNTNALAGKYDKTGGVVSGSATFQNTIGSTFAGDNFWNGSLTVSNPQVGKLRFTAVGGTSFIQSNGDIRFSNYASGNIRALIDTGNNLSVGGGYYQTGSSPSVLSGLLTPNGGVDMCGNTITNLPAPSTDNEPATKGYTDTGLATKLSKSGDTMTGQLNMGGFRIVNGLAPNSSTDIATKGYVDQAVAGGGSGGSPVFDAPVLINGANTGVNALTISGTQPTTQMVVSAGTLKDDLVGNTYTKEFVEGAYDFNVVKSLTTIPQNLGGTGNDQVSYVQLGQSIFQSPVGNTGVHVKNFFTPSTPILANPTTLGFNTIAPGDNGTVQIGQNGIATFDNNGSPVRRFLYTEYPPVETFLAYQNGNTGGGKGTCDITITDRSYDITLVIDNTVGGEGDFQVQVRSWNAGYVSQIANVYDSDTNTIATNKQYTVPQGQFLLVKVMVRKLDYMVASSPLTDNYIFTQTITRT